MQNVLITTLSFNRLQQNEITKLKHSFFKCGWFKGEHDKKFE